MQRTFWSNLNKGLVWAALGVAFTIPVSAGQASVPVCASLPATEAQTAAVRDSWPVVLRNAFDADGSGHEHLSLTVLIPISRSDAPPCLASYLISNLHLSPDETIIGDVIPTSRDYPVFFYEQVTVDPALIIDWRYVPPGGDLAFGGYRTRALLANPTDVDLAGLGLQPSVKPSDWN
jgi:hypothetical protein